MENSRSISYHVDPVDGKPEGKIKDAAFFPQSGTYPWEPLLTFPNEKQRALSDDARGFYDIFFTRKVWDHAATVLSRAEQVTVIGYSFNSIDRHSVVKNLLSKAKSCQEIVVSNPHVQTVCRDLSEECPEELQKWLEKRLVPREEYFEQRCIERSASQRPPEFGK